MGAEPLKKELEAIDQELESAMLRLTETSQRVDEVLAGFEPGETPARRPSTIIELHRAADQADDEPAESADGESDHAHDE